MLAGVDAQRAGNTLVLQAVANVDTHWTNLYAMPAVGAFAKALGLPLLRRSETPARLDPALRTLSPFFIIGNDQGVVIEHGALEPGIGTHVGADLLARQSGHDEGSGGQEERGEIGGVGRLAGQHFHHQHRRIGPVHGESQAGPEGDQQPQAIGGPFLDQLLSIPGLAVQPHPRRPLALHPVLDHDVQIGPQGLEAKITAPDPTGETRHEKQQDRRDHQDTGQPEEILHLDGQTENIEMPARQVVQHRLVGRVGPIPAQPGQQEVHGVGQNQNAGFEIAETTLGRAWINWNAFLIKLDIFGHDPPDWCEAVRTAMLTASGNRRHCDPSNGRLAGVREKSRWWVKHQVEVHKCRAPCAGARVG